MSAARVCLVVLLCALPVKRCNAACCPYSAAGLCITPEYPGFGDKCVEGTVLQNGECFGDTDPGPPNFQVCTPLGGGGFQNCKCQVPPSVTGDPVVAGFDGRVFNFHGMAGRFVSMISEADHLLNVLMVPAGFVDDHHPNGGTFIGALAYCYGPHHIIANISAGGDMQVVVDGEAVPTAKYYKELHDGRAMIEMEPFYPELGHIIVISTPLLVVRVQAVQPVTVNGINHRGHLDFVTTLLKAPTSMHGVLGQTAVADQQRFPLEDQQFHGKGDEADYFVSDLLAHDFQFNLFDPSHFDVEARNGRISLGLLPVDGPLTAGIFSNPRLLEARAR